MVVPVLAREGALGAFLARDAELLARELAFPLAVGFHDLVDHVSSQLEHAGDVAACAIVSAVPAHSLHTGAIAGAGFALDNAQPESFRRDVRVIGLIGIAHAFSHFFQLALPPLFPLLRADFDVSWTLLGLLVGVFYAASGVTQFVVGLRGRPPRRAPGAPRRPRAARGRHRPRGARAERVLAVPDRRAHGHRQRRVPSVRLRDPQCQRRAAPAWPRVLDPRRRRQPRLCPRADRELRARRRVQLARRDSPSWASRALSRCAILASQRTYLTSHRAPDAHTHSLTGSMGLFLQPAILLCFGYFVIQTTASVGLQTFLPSALNSGLAVPLVLATTAVTAYLLGSTGGHRRRRLPRRAHRAARHRRRPRACSPARRCSRSSGSARVPVRDDRADVRADRLRDRRDRALARSHRAQRDAQGRGGPRVWLRVLGTRPRRDGRADVVRPHARPRPGPRDVLRGRRAARARGRHGRARAARDRSRA